MRNGLTIRTDIEVEVLRRQAGLEADGRVAARLLAIANALSGMSRQAAAEAAGRRCGTGFTVSTPWALPGFLTGPGRAGAPGSATANRLS